MRIGVIAGLSLLGAAFAAAPPARPGHGASKTDAYIASLDLARVERLGRDILSPRYYDPARFGKPPEEVEKGDYDFERLADVERRLEGVDRRRALAHIFKAITTGVETDTERHVAILRFLHRASVHATVR